MNKKGLSIVLITVVTMMMVSCKKAESLETLTPETKALLVGLAEMPQQGIMFGHHDDPLYGIGWEGDEGRSDVKSVCGDYPAVMSYDIGHIELGANESLDKIPFDKIRKEIIAQYNRGGMNTISWHLDNPKTGGDSWDISDSTVVESVLPGGENHEMFLGWIDRMSDYLNSLQTEEGVKVPILFRPWHEHTGSWFWWGQNLCNTEDYKALWRMTYDRMKENGVNNVLFAYSPGIEPRSTDEYLERYPGDDIVDLLGFDAYQYGDRDQYLGWMNNSLNILEQVGKEHNKPIALTETGYETIPDSTWWTQTLMPTIANYPISYVVVWRNAREKENHYYAPYPGHVSADDFVLFYEQPQMLFANDVKDKLYKNK